MEQNRRQGALKLPGTPMRRHREWTDHSGLRLTFVLTSHEENDGDALVVESYPGEAARARYPSKWWGGDLSLFLIASVQLHWLQ